MIIYFGIDHHKKFCQTCVMNEQGHIVYEGSVAPTREAFLYLRDKFTGAVIHCVLEAGRCWGPLYDILEELELHPQLANPSKVRMIADSFVKTDKVDARSLAFLLRAGIVPQVHVPPKDIRDRKNVLRHRIWLVKEQTRLKNRIHNIVDRNHLQTPPGSDLFGSHGRCWLNNLSLSQPDQELLRSHLALLDQIQLHIRHTTKQVELLCGAHPLFRIFESLPGFGDLLSPLAALEVHQIERFPSPEKFTSYCGLATSVYRSANVGSYGHLIPACNHHLRYAFVEAAWTAVRTSPYFSAYFNRLRRRLGSLSAILQVSRRLCSIAYKCLTENRLYEERPYRFGSGRLQPSLAS